MSVLRSMKGSCVHSAMINIVWKGFVVVVAHRRCVHSAVIYIVWKGSVAVVPHWRRAQSAVLYIVWQGSVAVVYNLSWAWIRNQSTCFNVTGNQWWFPHRSLPFVARSPKGMLRNHGTFAMILSNSVLASTMVMLFFGGSKCIACAFEICADNIRDIYRLSFPVVWAVLEFMPFFH